MQYGEGRGEEGSSGFRLNRLNRYVSAFGAQGEDRERQGRRRGAQHYRKKKKKEGKKEKHLDSVSCFREDGDSAGGERKGGGGAGVVLNL